MGSSSTPFPFSKNPAAVNSESVSASLVETKSTLKHVARETESSDKDNCLICFEGNWFIYSLIVMFEKY